MLSCIFYAFLSHSFFISRWICPCALEHFTVTSRAKQKCKSNRFCLAIIIEFNYAATNEIWFLDRNRSLGVERFVWVVYEHSRHIRALVFRFGSTFSQVSVEFINQTRNNFMCTSSEQVFAFHCSQQKLSLVERKLLIQINSWQTTKKKSLRLVQLCSKCSHTLINLRSNVTRVEQSSRERAPKQQPSGVFTYARRDDAVWVWAAHLVDFRPCVEWNSDSLWSD